MRLPALDFVKAVAIVAVALTHALPGFFDEGMNETHLFIHFLVGFHVPAFLMVSGFLSKADVPAGARRVAERLGRIVPPYLVACLVASALGLAFYRTWWRVFFKVTTGAVLGHYYFVPVLAFCFVLLPAITRLSNRQLVATIAILAVLAEVTWNVPGLRLSGLIFWQIRDPILQFHLGYFLLGALAYRHRSALGRFVAGNPIACALGAVVVMAMATSFAWTHTLSAAHPSVHAAYAVAVVSLVAVATRHRSVPPVVRFLSDATFTLYLYHTFPYSLVTPYVAALPLGVRMIVLSGVGLAFGSLVVVAGRRLGSRSRVLLGA